MITYAVGFGLLTLALGWMVDQGYKSVTAQIATNNAETKAVAIEVKQVANEVKEVAMESARWSGKVERVIEELARLNQSNNVIVADTNKMATEMILGRAEQAKVSQTLVKWLEEQERSALKP